MPAWLGPHVVFRFLKLLRELLIGGATVEESLVNRPADFSEGSRRFHDRFDKRRDVFSKRLAGSSRVLGQFRLGVPRKTQRHGNLQECWGCHHRDAAGAAGDGSRPEPRGAERADRSLYMVAAYHFGSYDAVAEGGRNRAGIGWEASFMGPGRVVSALQMRHASGANVNVGAVKVTDIPLFGAIQATSKTTMPPCGGRRHRTCRRSQNDLVDQG